MFKKHLKNVPTRADTFIISAFGGRVRDGIGVPETESKRNTKRRGTGFLQQSEVVPLSDVP